MFIISNDCWGTGVYRKLSLPYQTPFVNGFIPYIDYIALLKKLDYYLSKELIIVKANNSKYFNSDMNYFLGILEDIEIHFSHYVVGTYSIEAIKENWKKRLNRLTLNRNDIIFKFGTLNERIECNNFQELLKDFYDLQFPRKISFTPESFNFPNNFIPKNNVLKNAMMLGYNFSDYIQLNQI